MNCTADGLQRLGSAWYSSDSRIKGNSRGSFYIGSSFYTGPCASAWNVGNNFFVALLVKEEGQLRDQQDKYI